MNHRITDEGVAGLPLAEGRAELLEEIMRSSTSASRPHRPLLVPLAAAAAVVAIAGGAWALTAGDERSTSPEGPGFGSAPTAPPSRASEEATPTGPSQDTCIVAYDPGSPPPSTTGPELDHCETVVLDEREPFEEVETYQRPPRPVLITADGWAPADVFGSNISWEGPGGERVHLHWVQTASPDPFAYDRYERRGERVDVLGLVGRLTGFTERGEFQVLVTSPVQDGGPGLVLETSALGPEEFRTLVSSLAWVTLEEYDAVVKPAVR